MLWLGACGDPALDRYADALDAYERAKSEPSGAVDAIREARKADPKSTTLALWEARHLAAAGRTAEAVDALGLLLRAHPDLGIAWYNRAAYRVRVGEMAPAAADLEQAFRLGAAQPLDAAADPDFAAALGHPAFAAVLPPQPLVADVVGPEGSIFLGGDVEIAVEVVAPKGVRWQVERQGTDPGCLRLAAIVQEDQGPKTRLLLRFRGIAACSGAVGPFRVSTAGASVETPAVELTVDAPPGAPPPSVPPLPVDLPVPASLAGEGWKTVRLADGALAIGPADRTLAGNGRRPDTTLTWRVDGTTRAAGGIWWEKADVAVSAKGWEKTIPGEGAPAPQPPPAKPERGETLPFSPPSSRG